MPNPPSQPVIDFHVHAFPFWDRSVLARLPLPIGSMRRKARSLFSPLTSTLHQAQTWARHLPDPARRAVDALGALAPAPNLLVESSPGDLIETMDRVGVDQAVLIAHEPTIPNAFVLEQCRIQAHRLIAAVTIPAGTPDPADALRKAHADGAKILKIHAAAEGESPDSLHYNALLKAATELGMPVILHTGCLHLPLVFKKPDFGRVEHFRPWFEEFGDTRFVLAHMNFHEPIVALDLCQEFPNLLVDTSWQPVETIHEAVRRIGAERVLFGSDWPMVGNNIEVGLSRIDECVRMDWITEEQAALIRGKNAARLLGHEESRDA